MNLKQSIRIILKEETNLDEQQLFLNECKKTEAYQYFENRFKLDTVDDDEAIVDTEHDYVYRMNNRTIQYTISYITEDIKYATDTPKTLLQLTRIYDRFCNSVLPECYEVDLQKKVHRVIHMMVRNSLIEMRTHD
jgi:hypothetical protein